MKRWPLALIAPAAAVAIWSGWVGLGELCGFGPVHVLPGIAPRFVVNTAICLPVGMEAYAGFALGVWLRDSGVPDRAKDFARWSAFGALALGVLGQVAFHVLSSLRVEHAPIWVVVFVSCIPVGVLGLAAALAHLMSEPAETPRAGTVSSPVFTDAQTAALAFYRGTVAAGNPATQNKLAAQFRLSRAEARDVIERGRGGQLRPATVPAAQAAPAGILPPVPAGVIPSSNGKPDG